MECARHWVWHCWRRKCSIVDVTSSDEKSWFSIWALTTAVIPELSKTRNVETQAQDVKEHSFSYGLPRHCLVHECSVFQDTWRTEFLFSIWTLRRPLPLLLMMTGKLTTTGRNWSDTTRPIVGNFSRLQVPSVRFPLMILNLHGQPLLRWRMEQRRWRQMIGGQSQVQKNVWTSNGVEELFSRSKMEWNSQKNCLLSSRQVSSLEFLIPVTRWNLHTLHQERKQMLLSQAQHQLRKASRVDQVRQDLNDDLVRRQPLLLRMNMNNFSDELERGLDRAVEMELGKSDKSKDRRPKDDDVDISPSSDDGWR